MGITIGLTGGIATGKSTVSKIFAQSGVPVIDADIAAREVVKKGTAGLEEVKKAFGPFILRGDGELNRSKLADIIFNDPQKRQRLNEIVHPRVKKWMMAKRRELFSKNYKLVLFDIPLLFESHLTDIVDEIVVVVVSKEMQMERLIKREHFSEHEAKIRIDAQMNLDEKRKRADYVIDNNFSKETTKKAVEKLIEQIKNKHSL